MRSLHDGGVAAGIATSWAAAGLGFPGPRYKVVHRLLSTSFSISAGAAASTMIHPKAASRSHVEVSGLAAAVPMPRISVDTVHVHSLFSSGGAGA